MFRGSDGAQTRSIPFLLDLSPYGQRGLGCRRERLPITERVAASLVRLPLHTHLTEEDIEFLLE